MGIAISTRTDDECPWEFVVALPQCCGRPQPIPARAPLHLSPSMSNKDYYGGGQPPYPQGQGQYYPPQG